MIRPGPVSYSGFAQFTRFVSSTIASIQKDAPAASASARARRFSSSFVRRCASQSCMAATDLPPAAALDFLLICGLKLCTASCFFTVSAF